MIISLENPFFLSSFAWPFKTGLTVSESNHSVTETCCVADEDNWSYSSDEEEDEKKPVISNILNSLSTQVSHQSKPKDVLLSLYTEKGV